MNDNVVTTGQFALMSKDVLDELEQSGVKVSSAALEDLGLPEVGYGERILGELTAEEQQLFVQYYEANKEAERLHRFVGAHMLRKTADAVEVGTEEEYLKGIAGEREMSAGDLGVADSDVVAYFKVDRLREYLRSAFFYRLSTRLGVYDHMLGVRTRGRVVQGKRRW